MLTASRPLASPLLKLYLAAWAGYFVLLTVLPVSYSRLQAPLAVISLCLWIAISCVVAMIVEWLLGRARSTALRLPLSGGRPLSLTDLKRIIYFGMTLSVAGFLCLLYDRIFVQHIDFSQGIAVARELWRQAGEDRSGVSSAFSVIGYLIGSAFFCSIAIAHLHWEIVPTALRRLVTYGGLLLVMGNSLLTGGRSIILVQLAAVVAVAGIRKLHGLRGFPGRGLRTAAIGLAVLSLAIGYSVYVFGQRAIAGRTLPALYADTEVAYLGGQPTPAYFAIDDLPSGISGFADLSVVAGMYLTHSYGTFEAVLEGGNLPGSATFIYVRELLAKLSLIPPANNDWVFQGLFLSLPGSLYYDFSWPGFYLGAVLLGLALGCVPALLIRTGGSGLFLSLGLLFVLCALLAPLLLAIDILSVPFMVLGFILVDALNRMRGGGTNWLIVADPVSLYEPVAKRQ